MKKMKKILSLLLVFAMLTAVLAGCRGAETAKVDTKGEAEEETATATDDTADAETTTDEAADEAADETTGEVEPYKIGIITGTVSQGEEEFQAAQSMIAKYGADKIVTATYPDNFDKETETVIAQVVALSNDPEVKAIIFVQAVPGAIAAIEKTRETRPDMLFITGVAAEPPRDIAEASDIVLLVDELGMGTTVIEQAKKQGATTFVHYSFPRHLGYETISARRELFIKTCEELGIKYEDVTAPDPTSDAGVSGAQQFITEDVPRQIEKYGKETAFFSTNCSMQEPLIRGVLEEQAIYPQQCCPSPYHGYPGALNIEVAGHEGDVQYMLDQIASKVADGENTGRMSTWALPVNMLMVESGVKYAIEFCEGRTAGTHDPAVIKASIEAVAADPYDTTATLSNFTDSEGSIDNFYMILCDYYSF